MGTRVEQADGRGVAGGSSTTRYTLHPHPQASSSKQNVRTWRNSRTRASQHASLHFAARRRSGEIIPHACEVTSEHSGTHPRSSQRNAASERSTVSWRRARGGQTHGAHRRPQATTATATRKRPNERTNERTAKRRNTNNTMPPTDRPTTNANTTTNERTNKRTKCLQAVTTASKSNDQERSEHHRTGFHLLSSCCWLAGWLPWLTD